jgi:NAD(P)-dependent dehydrogenase (short-subunit alcohol dehydrogenase family)
MQKIALITGGGRGIGAATAKLAAQRGFAVAVNYRTRAGDAEKVVAAIRQGGGKAIAVQADTALDTDVVRLFKTVDRELGTLTALVNNAGATGGVRLVQDADAAQLEELFRVNVIGCFLCAREAIRRMSTQFGGSGGSIVNVSSKAATIGGGGEWIHYAASKGALDTFTIGLTREVGAQGIRVNAVRPGMIETELQAQGLPGRVEKAVASVPMLRAGSAQEVAEAIVWLMSDAASYVHGAFLDVSGGR